MVDEMFSMLVIFGLPIAGIVACGAILSLTILGLVFGVKFFAYKDRELEIRKLEVEGRIQNARLLAGAPPWLDREDPDTLLAWAAARTEVARIEANPRPTRPTPQG
jgi:hypothetical protein